MSIESLMLSNHLILCLLFLLLSSVFPSIRVFSSEWALCIRWPKYWSFSNSPSNEYLGLISFRIDSSPCCLRDSQESSPAPVQKHLFFSVQLSLWSNSQFIHDYWENQIFEYMDLCQQSNVFVRMSIFCFY